jgi:outer membrane receptor protein involved in Fe transport
LAALRVDCQRSRRPTQRQEHLGAQTDEDTLKAGFLRWENAFAPTTTLYAGLGHSERAADYWERTKAPGATSTMMTGTASTFFVKPEKTTQLDTGAIYAAGPLRASASLFYAKHTDFIQIRQINAFATDALNVDATTYGLEGDVSYALGNFWKTWATLAWTHGENDSTGKPLSQIARWKPASAPATTTRPGAPARCCASCRARNATTPATATSWVRTSAHPAASPSSP